MRTGLRYFLINLASLWLTSEILKGFTYEGGIRSLLIGGVVFTAINLLLVPLVKIMLLPLNLLTLGVFAWVTNVLALYILTVVVPQFRILPYHFPGFEYLGFVIPSVDLSMLWVIIVASFLIGFFTHFLHWLLH